MAIQWTMLSILILLSIYSYVVLPKVIPIHFNLKGVADGFGHKYHVFILPLVGLLLSLAFNYISLRPYLANYPMEINPQNAKKSYTFMSRFLTLLNSATLLLFIIIVAKVLTLSQQLPFVSSSWSLSIFIMTLFIFPIVLFIGLFRSDQK